jgi:hypothetical protein
VLKVPSTLDVSVLEWYFSESAEETLDKTTLVVTDGPDPEIISKAAKVMLEAETVDSEPMVRVNGIFSV